MASERLFELYTDAGILTLIVSCGEAKVIGRLEGQANQPAVTHLNPAQTGDAPDVVEKHVGPEVFEGESEAITVDAARRWVERQFGPIRATRERGCEPE